MKVDQNMQKRAKIVTTPARARVTREVSELSQNSLQEQFVHVVEPRKLNEAGKRQAKRLILCLFTVYLALLIVVISCFVRIDDFLLIIVYLLFLQCE